MQTIADRKNVLPQAGRVEWIGLSAAPRSEIRTVPWAEARAGTGLVDDYHALSGKSDRQVTLIQREHLAAIGDFMGRETIAPELTRRNLVVAGVNLLALKDRQFEVGEALLEGTGPCDPCSRMEENLGPGGFNSMRGHGGITARVLRGGAIRVGDAVRLASDSAEAR